MMRPSLVAPSTPTRKNLETGFFAVVDIGLTRCWLMGCRSGVATCQPMVSVVSCALKPLRVWQWRGLLDVVAMLRARGQPRCHAP
ncbi:hypothetical protein D3C72_1161660 [compost metagenome]